MNDRHGTRFYCFSPPVMLATLTIEFTLAIYSFIRYKMTPISRLIVGILVGLATFQMAEYHVCTGAGSAASAWSRLGFITITVLPALGLHLMQVLANQRSAKLVYGTYLAMLGFMAYFLVAPVFSGYQCTGNYVIFQFSERVTGLYSLYYFGLLFMGLGLGWHWRDVLKRQAKQKQSQLQAISGLMVGYLVFLVPVAVVNVIRPKTQEGIPSLMCGFAVLLAFVLVGYILPRSGRLRSWSKT